MLRPKRMSKVSVTGAHSVMDDVIEAVHGLNLVHLSDYDGRWRGFENGNTMAGGDEASQKLVTIRALKNTLGVTEEDAGPVRSVSEAALDEKLEEVRQETNELDDQRDEIRNDLRAVEEEIDTLEPFATLGIDLDLLWGYDSLAVAVGEGDADSVEAAVAELEAPTQLFSTDGVVAAFAAVGDESPDQDAFESALVEAAFTEVEVPREEGDPDDYLEDRRQQKQRLESNLETVDNQIEDLRHEVGGFLLAAEEKLAIRARKAEAPLSFATTANAFVAEGWIPTERTDAFEAAIREAVGERAAVEELERAAYDRHGHAATQESVHDAGAATESTTAEAGDTEEAEPSVVSEESADPATAETDGGEDVGSGGGSPTDAGNGTAELRSDGGVVTMGDDDPPVVQDNPTVARPFELLTQAVGRPNYSEFDPTVILFLTFPLMFGFIIGDVGYGLIYTGLGYWLYASFDSQAFERFGIIAAAAGVATTVFGVLYGEIFGLHLVTSQFWVGVVGLEHAPIEKGLSPATSYWASAWFIVTALFGVLHMNTAYVLEFLENNALHGLKEATLESGSWLLALNGLWLFIFSHMFRGSKPDLLFETFDSGPTAAFELGFSGFSPEVGMVGLGMFALGAVFLAIGPTHELIEIHVTLAHALSYLRIAAVLLAKAGMAFAVNLLFWGAYAVPGDHGAEWHFMLSHGPEYVTEHHEQAEILFGGMVHMGAVAAAAGVAVLVVGHIVVLLLGITSSGIQSIRLEYFEFFSKFYEGDGRVYRPFGTERSYTEDGS
jgi:V/A-type H+-transporting ATPase subunit I